MPAPFGNQYAKGAEGSGRPKKEIDLDMVAKLARIQCTQEEIAQCLGVCVDTLQRNEEFSGVYKKGLEEGRSSLRRLQWKQAEAGNATMLVWLGKQYLKQTDKQETQLTPPPGGFDVNLYTMSPEERQARINELNAKRGAGTALPPGTGREGSETPGS